MINIQKYIVLLCSDFKLYKNIFENVNNFWKNTSKTFKQLFNKFIYNL